MIYAIRAVGTEFVKFGRTDGLSPKKRLDTMQTGCPYPLELLAVCEGDKATEAFIHMMLRKAGALHRGEWFKWGVDAEAIVGMMKDGSLKIAEAEIAPNAYLRAPRHKRLGAALELNERLMAKRKPRRTRHGQPIHQGNT